MKLLMLFVLFVLFMSGCAGNSVMRFQPTAESWYLMNIGAQLMRDSAQRSEPAYGGRVSCFSAGAHTTCNSW